MPKSLIGLVVCMGGSASTSKERPQFVVDDEEVHRRAQSHEVAELISKELRSPFNSNPALTADHLRLADISWKKIIEGTSERFIRSQLSSGPTVIGENCLTWFAKKYVILL